MDGDAVNVDSILLAAIPHAIPSVGKHEFSSQLLKVANGIQASTPKGSNPNPDIDNYTLIDNGWMDDTVCMDSQVTGKLHETFQSHTGIRQAFAYNRSNGGTVRQLREKDYVDFDSEAVRLLGLFRYWNMINYFYPLKNHMEENWDEVLLEFIPIFRNATSNVAYRKAIYRLTNKLKDTHASYPASVDGAVTGKYRPNFTAKRIGDSIVIERFRFPDEMEDGFQQGDILLESDGREVLAMYDSLSSITGGGNYWSEQRFICNALLATREKSTMYKVLRGHDTLTIVSKNETAWNLHKKGLKVSKSNEAKPQFKFITDSVAYLNLASITRDNFEQNFEPIRNAKTIILDLRCYPTTKLVFDLSENFVPPDSYFAHITYVDARFPGMLRYYPSSGKIGAKQYYKGRVLVLVNERTESYSEYLTMMLQANPNTVVVGSPSSGADGNISTVEFPGGIKTIYTGIGIYYPDMTPTQRKGVKIDYVVEPTVESIQRGADIILEKAIDIASR